MRQKRDRLQRSVSIVNQAKTIFPNAARSGIEVQDGRLSPLELLMYACGAKEAGVQNHRFKFQSPRLAAYASLMGFRRAVWGMDDYEKKRRNEGKSYSTIQTLSAGSNFAAEASMSRICGCLERTLQDGPFRREFFKVIGELHDNVLSHSQSYGFTAAQVYRQGDEVLFAIVDRGIGLLREMKRVNLGHDLDHAGAIRWCIMEGNTTKGSRRDEFAQRLPSDIIGGSPMPQGLHFSDNNHMGLGLYRLVECVREFEGELFLATGNAVFHLSEKADLYGTMEDEWPGVAISVGFRAKRFGKTVAPLPMSDILNIIEKLRLRKR